MHTIARLTTRLTARARNLLQPPHCDDAPRTPRSCRTCDAPATTYAPGFGWVCANTGH